MFSFFIGQFFPSHSIVIISIILSFPKIAAALFVNSFGSVEKKFSLTCLVNVGCSLNGCKIQESPLKSTRVVISRFNGLDDLAGGGLTGRISEAEMKIDY
jgi:hypothetical protein